MLLLCFAAHAQQAPGGSAAADAKKALPERPAAPAAVPLAELSQQAEAATVTLREITTRAAVSPVVEEIARDLPALAREIDVRTRENERIISQRPSVELLGTLERSWQRIRKTLSVWSTDLDERIGILDGDLARLAELEQTWKQTLVLAAKEESAPELRKRVETLLAAIAKTRELVEAQRAEALRLQSRVAAQEFRVTEALEAIRLARDAMLARILERDSPPLWSMALLARAGNRIVVDSLESREAQFVTLKNYAQRRWDRFMLHGLFFIALAGFLYWVRFRINEWARDEPGLQHPAQVFAWPVATALLLSIIGSRWIYPEAPRLLWATLGALALIPTVLVLRRLVAPYLVPLLYAVVAFYLTDQVRAITASIELVPRLLFLTEMLGGAAFLWWFRRTLKPVLPQDAAHRRSRMFTRLGIRVACVFFVLTALTNAIGYVALANLIGNAVLRSMYFGLVLYALVEILDALMIMALRVRPLTLLTMVQRHRDVLRRRLRRVLNALAIVLWASFTLDRLAVREQILSAAKEALTAQLSIGAIHISLGDVLAFCLAVWASFLVSRFVRFVLNEEVFPHARLKRGLPYAISQTVHYLILVAGFFVAMAALGLDMTKFTILAGAFTVGVGFGLQNIFNNFVSGLILLYERPVQVGDLIQMDDATGVVERIGIRASIVRTSNGSEIIVPNGKLISERLVNWTFSERQRGIDVAISVVLGTDPQRVISILERVATDHPKILKKPPPQALLTRLGPDWMGFELHAFTDHIEDWMQVRSELAVAIAAALMRENITLR
ncbi:MAG: mechanosensitive ion channel domain-containing protein [Burkholderiales bacterium]